MQKIYFEKECTVIEDDHFEDFCKKYFPITAGGGLVQNDNGEYLLIYRHSLWDLPKGKIEPGETVSQCALREVEEETGLKGLILGNPICITHHTYTLHGIPCIKHTNWYHMYYSGNDSPVPQLEEDITDAVWAKPDELAEKIKETYPSIREVIATAGL